jgi:hypothetical protein
MAAAISEHNMPEEAANYSQDGWTADDHVMLYGVLALSEP